MGIYDLRFVIADLLEFNLQVAARKAR